MSTQTHDHGFRDSKVSTSCSKWWNHEYWSRVSSIIWGNNFQYPYMKSSGTRSANEKPNWSHQMETFSALLALYEGNPPVDSLSSYRPVTRSFDILFDLRLNKRLSRQPRRHRAHYDVTVMIVLKRCEWTRVVVTAMVTRPNPIIPWSPFQSKHRISEYRNFHCNYKAVSLLRIPILVRRSFDWDRPLDMQCFLVVLFPSHRLAPGTVA